MGNRPCPWRRWGSLLNRHPRAVGCCTAQPAGAQEEYVCRSEGVKKATTTLSWPWKLPRLDLWFHVESAVLSTPAWRCSCWWLVSWPEEGKVILRKLNIRDSACSHQWSAALLPSRRLSVSSCQVECERASSQSNALLCRRLRGCSLAQGCRRPTATRPDIMQKHRNTRTLSMDEYTACKNYYIF